MLYCGTYLVNEVDYHSSLGKPRCYEVNVKSVTRDNIDEWSPSFEPRRCVAKPGTRKEKMAPLASMWYNMHFDSFLHQRYALFDFFLLAEQKEELCRFQTMVEPFLWLLREKRSDFKVEGKSTIVEVLTKVICYTQTHANIPAYAPPGPRPPSYRTSVTVHTITLELYFFVSTSLIQVFEKSLAWPGGVCQSC